MNHFLRLGSLVILLFLAFQPVIGQTVYYQNFSSGLDSWTTSNTTAITSNTTSASSGYTTPIMASGGLNLSFGECGGNAEHTVTSNAISTVGRTNLMVGFGRRKTASFGPQVVIFEFSNNGGASWTTISSDVSSAATTIWGVSVFNLLASAENQASVQFRFRFTPPSGFACGTSFRIDDFTVSENSSLPVEFAYFQGTAQRNGNHLTWETTWESGASHFTVERSADAREFGDIGKVVASGHSTSKHVYSFTDGEPLTGTSYYRLRQVDADGAEQVSKIIAVSRSEEQLVVCENPSSGDEIRLRVSRANPASFQLLMPTGQSLPFHLIHKSETEWVIRPVQALKPGLYLISVGQNNQRRTIRFIVQ